MARTIDKVLVVGAVFMMALIAMNVVGVDLPADFVVEVMDDSGNSDEQMLDQIGYLGDSFMFGIDAGPFYDLGYEPEAANISAVLYIDTTVQEVITLDYWNFTDIGGSRVFMGMWTSDEVGTFTWHVNISDVADPSNSLITEGTVQVLPLLVFNSAYPLTATTPEDTPLVWNLSTAFTGSNVGLAIAWPADWTAANGWAIVETDPADAYPVYSITPPSNFVGYGLVSVNATDDYISYNVQVFNLTWTAVNDVPVIAGIMVGSDLLTVNTWNAGNTTNPDNKTAINITLTEDTPLDIMVHATDIDSSDLTYALTADEALYAVALTEYLNETNVTYTVPTNFTLTPVANANGNFFAELNVSDESLWATIMVNVIITATNDAPTATEAWDPTYAKYTGEEINVTLPVTADIDGDAVTVTWYIDGTAVTWTITEYFAHTFTAAGTYNVSAKISDGTATVEVGYFLVTVTIANRAPTITSTTASKAEITEGDAVTLTVVATDLDGNTLSYSWKNDKVSAWSSNKSVVEVKDLKKGTYNFTVTVSDGTLTDTSYVLVTVKEKEESSLTTIIIIVIAIIAILAILIILFFVLRGGKEEEEAAPAETPAEGEEAPAPEEQPVGEETPAEETPETPTEEPVAETPEQAPEEEVPAPPAPPQ